MKRSLSVFTLALALVVGVALALGAPLLAQAQKKDDPVLARVNGVEIRQSDIEIADGDVGQSLQETDPNERRAKLLAYLVDVTALAQAAAKKKMDSAPDYAQRLAYVKNKVLMELLLSDLLKTAGSDGEVKKLYEQYAAKGMLDEVRARHILVKTEDEAKAVLAKVKGGADFEKLAREISIDPTAKTNGGDLEYFVQGDMVPEFSNAAFALKKGELSAPVKTQFGFHIIKVEDRRAKKFEEIKDRLQAVAVRQAQAELVLKTRTEAKIENLVKKEEPAAPPAKADPKKK